MQKKATEIVDGLIKQMDLRYKDTNEDLLRSTLIASFRNWPTLNEPGIYNCILDCYVFNQLF